MNKKEITKEWGKLEKTIYEDSDFSIEITEIYKDNNGIERRYITTRDKNIKDFDKYNKQKEVLDKIKEYIREEKEEYEKGQIVGYEKIEKLLEEIDK